MNRTTNTAPADSGQQIPILDDSRRPAWIAMAGWSVSVALLCVGYASSSYTLPAYTLEIPGEGFGDIAGCCWVLELLFLGGAVFAMIVGRKYIPRTAALVGAVGAVAGGLSTLMFGRALSSTHGAEVLPNLWLTLVGFVGCVTCAGVLWKIGASSARRSKAELARANLVQLIEEGGIVPDDRTEDDNGPT